VLQAALLGLVALLLAFGQSLAVSRYEDRRSNIVTEANTIGTTYLRAQTLAEPIRSRSLDLLVSYTRSAIRVSDQVLNSAEADDARAQEERINVGCGSSQEKLSRWRRRPARATSIRRDAERDDRRGDCARRCPGRGVLAVSPASGLVAFLLLVTADLDRPTRGMIQVPDTPLTNQLASVEEPPAATAAPLPVGALIGGAAASAPARMTTAR
jgi:hypothetical protein